jgi:hypothetical protein
MKMKELTKAQKQVHEFRDSYHKGKMKIQDKQSSAVVYIGKNVNCKPTAHMYQGRAKRPYSAYYYNSMESLQQAINEFFERIREREYRKQSRMKINELRVGDVLRSSWGYEQTNIDYYQVTKLIGKSMVEIQEIGKLVDYNGVDHSTCSPSVNEFIGEPMRKKVDGDSVKVRSCARAYKMKPKHILADGVKVYGTDRWSSWH